MSLLKLRVSLSIVGLSAVVLSSAYLAPEPTRSPRAAAPEQPAERTLYIFDLRKAFVNHGPYILNKPGYERGSPPPGKDFPGMVQDYDLINFVVSLQGLVNRAGPRLYLIHQDVDQLWLDTLRQGGWWLADYRLEYIPDLAALLNTFPQGATGSVAWSAEVPATLNVATTIAGAEGLVIVREGSPLFGQITATFPVKVDLRGQITGKTQAYRWALERYLATGKSDPHLLAFIQDGWPVRLMAGDQPQMTRSAWDVMRRDYIIQNRGFAFELSPWGDEQPIDDPGQPLGEDLKAFQEILSTARRKAGGDLINFWGSALPKYHSDPDIGGSASNKHTGVPTEWEISWLVSSHGAVIRGGTDLLGLELANASIWKHGPFPERVVQNPPLTPQQMVERGYLVSPLANADFEQGAGGLAWTVEVGNWELKSDRARAYDGEKYLTLSATADNKSVSQDVPIEPLRGGRYTFSIAARAAEPVQVQMVAWALGGEAESASREFVVQGAEWQRLELPLEVGREGHKALRLQLFVNTPGRPLDLDAASLAGPNAYKVAGDKKFVMIYNGDYDGNNSLYVFRGLWPLWEEPARGTFPLAWGMAVHALNEIPPILAYFYQTKGAGDYFVAPNSGGGYINPGALPTTLYKSWRDENIALYRRAGLRLTWILNGKGWNDFSPGLLDLYRSFSADGIFYFTMADGDEIKLHKNMPIVPLVNAWGNFGPPEQATAWIYEHTPGQFTALREAYIDTEFLADVARRIKGERGYEVLDPVTFFYLLRHSLGGDNRYRATFVSDTLPASLEPGKSYTAQVVLRNDGWETWTKGGQYPYRLGLTLRPGRIEPQTLPFAGKSAYPFRHDLPLDVAPGQVITVPVTFQAPAPGGDYTVQLDLVQEEITWFEAAGNIPWQKKVAVY
jgi:hypothetical protein